MEPQELYNCLKEEVKFLKTERGKCFSYMSRDRFDRYFKNDRMKYLGFEPKHWYKCTDIVSRINVRLRAIEDYKDLVKVYIEMISSTNQIFGLRSEKDAVVKKREKTLQLMEQCMKANNDHVKTVVKSEFAKEIFGENIGTVISPAEAINKICQRIVELDNEIEYYDSLIVEVEADLYCEGDITESEQEKIVMDPDGYYYYMDTDMSARNINDYLLRVMRCDKTRE